MAEENEAGQAEEDVRKKGTPDAVLDLEPDMKPPVAEIIPVAAALPPRPESADEEAPDDESDVYDQKDRGPEESQPEEFSSGTPVSESMPEVIAGDAAVMEADSPGDTDEDAGVQKQPSADLDLEPDEASLSAAIETPAREMADDSVPDPETREDTQQNETRQDGDENPAAEDTAPDGEQEIAFEVAGISAAAAAALTGTDDDGVSGEEKKRRALVDEKLDAQRRENMAGSQAAPSASAGFQTAAASGSGTGAGAGSERAFDLSGGFRLHPKWLKNPRKYAHAINPRLDSIIKKALDNDWKYISVKRGGAVDPGVGMLLQNRIAYLALNPKEADRILARMGCDSAEARIEARRKLESMVVVQQKVDLTKYAADREAHRSPAADSARQTPAVAPQPVSAPETTPASAMTDSDLQARIRELGAELTRRGGLPDTSPAPQDPASSASAPVADAANRTAAAGQRRPLPGFSA